VAEEEESDTPFPGQMERDPLALTVGTAGGETTETFVAVDVAEQLPEVAVTV
jgi:hypothetical protein